MIVEVVYIPPAIMAMRNALSAAYRTPRDNEMADLVAKLKAK